MIAREIFSDYSLGADQLGTEAEISRDVFLPEILSNFLHANNFFCFQLYLGKSSATLSQQIFAFHWTFQSHQFNETKEKAPIMV